MGTQTALTSWCGCDRPLVGLGTADLQRVPSIGPSVVITEAGLLCDPILRVLPVSSPSSPSSSCVLPRAAPVAHLSIPFLLLVSLSRAPKSSPPLPPPCPAVPWARACRMTWRRVQLRPSLPRLILPPSPEVPPTLTLHCSRVSCPAKCR